MMANNFSDQVTEWVRKSDARMTAAFRESIQDLVEEAQEPRGSGGNMPIRTGFLRSTGDAALNKLPVGETEAPEGVESFTWDASAALLVINQAKLGDTVYFGWSANYAIYMEDRYGFVRLAAQNWPQIVNRAARRLEQRVRR